jgi:Spy/CpxP family protein refolding chaperone
MKKALVITALVVGVGLVGWQQASAGRGYGGFGPGNYYCQGPGPMAYSQIDQATQEKVDKFFDDTKDLRKAMIMKMAEQRALLRAEQPDPTKAAKVAGELFDLRTSIQDKAEAAGVDELIGPHGGMGYGMGAGMGRHHGLGPRMMGGPGFPDQR